MDADWREQVGQVLQDSADMALQREMANCLRLLVVAAHDAQFVDDEAATALIGRCLTALRDAGIRGWIVWP